MKTNRILMLEATLAGLVLFATSSALAAQENAEVRGSDNIEVVAHVPMGAEGSVSDIEISQDMDRPYVYLGREVFGDISGMERGIDVIDIRDPENPR